MRRLEAGRCLIKELNCFQWRILSLPLDKSVTIYRNFNFHRFVRLINPFLSTEDAALTLSNED